jgi:hypothetical protein
MRAIIVSLIIFISMSSFAQDFEGRIVCETGHSAVQYANIGVLNKNTGTTSDSNGYFKLDVSKINEDDIVLISCIGYEPQKIKASDFLKSVNHEILLKQHIYSLKETTVKPRRVKNKKLGVVSFSRKIQAGFTDNLLGYEFGILMHNKKSAKINKIKFDIASCTYDTLFYRINVYEQRTNGKPDFVNILTSPIYITIPKDKIKNIITVDVSKRDIYVNGNFLVTIEHIRNLNKGRLYFSCGLGTSTWHRKTSQGNWVKTPIGVSINVDAEVEY